MKKLNEKESKMMKKLNEVESVDAFEIMDIEEKLDFDAYLDGVCVNGACANIGCLF